MANKHLWPDIRFEANLVFRKPSLAFAAFRTFGDPLSGSSEAIIGGLFRQLAVWSDKPRWTGSEFARLVIELADLPGHPARLIARRQKALLESQPAELRRH
jgi:hypothetical protein